MGNAEYMGTHPIFESDFDCLTELNMSTERTFIAIKPDGVQRGLVGKILKRFEQRGFKLVAMKLCMPGKEHLEKHYADLSSKPFFAGLVEYMNSGPICAMVWEGLNVVKMGRMMLGETNPQASLPGSIRGDYSIQVGRNICHGSDAVESANHEIALWFKPEELMSYDSCTAKWIYEQFRSKKKLNEAPLPAKNRIQRYSSTVAFISLCNSVQKKPSLICIKVSIFTLWYLKKLIFKFS